MQEGESLQEGVLSSKVLVTSKARHLQIVQDSEEGEEGGDQLH